MITYELTLANTEAKCEPFDADLEFFELLEASNDIAVGILYDSYLINEYCYDSIAKLKI